MMFYQAARMLLDKGVLSDDAVNLLSYLSRNSTEYLDYRITVDANTGLVRTVDRNTSRATVRTFTKHVRFLVKKRLIDEPSDASVNAIAEKWGVVFSPEEFTFELTEEVSKIYTSGNYGGSCMTGEAHAYRTRFYDKNGVQLVLISSTRRGPIGRALLWPVEVAGTPRLAMDRIYPDDGGAHVQAALDHAASQGWLVRSHQGAPTSQTSFMDGEYHVDARFFPTDLSETSPYFDTFRLAEHDGSRLYFQAYRGNYAGTSRVYASDFSNNGGNFQAGWKVTDVFNNEEPFWEMINTLDGPISKKESDRLIQFNGEYALKDSVIHCAVTGQKDHVSRMREVSLFNSSYAVLVCRQALVPDNELAPEVRGGGYLHSQTEVLEYGLFRGLRYPTSRIRIRGGRRMTKSDAYVINCIEEGVSYSSGRYMVLTFSEDNRLEHHWVYRAKAEAQQGAQPRGVVIYLAQGADAMTLFDEGLNTL